MEDEHVGHLYACRTHLLHQMPVRFIRMISKRMRRLSCWKDFAIYQTKDGRKFADQKAAAVAPVIYLPRRLVDMVYV